MSYNDNNPNRSASRHRPALWAIAVAIGLAVVAFLLFAPMGGEEAETGDVEILAPGSDTGAGTGADTGAAATGTDATGTAPTTTAPASN